MPRDLADLPFATWLEPAEPLEADGEYDCRLFDRDELTDLDARHTVFGECAFRSVNFGGGTTRGARFADVWMQGVRITGTDMADTVWRDTEVIEGAWSGVEASGADLRRVVFHNCKLDSVNFRGGVLAKVRFVDCVLRHVDFGDAKLTEVEFPGTEIRALALRNARLRKIDFRQANSIGITEGIPALRGAAVTPGQLLDLAPALAADIGLIVEPI